jgi:xanthine dehydrogenase molybdopterin-binding subunit B
MTKIYTYILYENKIKEVKTMAVTKTIDSVSLSIEVQKALDKAGDPIYTKKTFSGIKTDATPENVYAVADAIKGVMEANTRDYFINESSSLANA